MWYLPHRLLLYIVCCMCLCGYLYAEQQPPNIIVFLVDDMGWQDTSVPFWRNQDNTPNPTFLNKRYRTPNMERLSEQGMVFTNAYAQPICSPSRCSLMSGMNSARHHVTNWTLHCDQSTDVNHPTLSPPPNWSVNGIQPHGTQSSGASTRPLTNRAFSYTMTKPFTPVLALPAILQQHGYVTIHCGKAHFGAKDTPGANPQLFGFDHNIAGTEIGGPADYRGAKHYGKGAFQVQGLNENEFVQHDVFLTEALTRKALQTLDAVRSSPESADKPFFLYMAHYAVHSPFDQRGYDKRFAGQYSNPHDSHPWSDNEQRYAGLLHGMDKSLGDILQYLQKHKLDKNTVILFMSDNGGLAISGRMGNRDSNYPLSFGKGSVMEGGIREPMIVVWNGVTKPGSVCHTPVIIEDFFPSVLDIAGITHARIPQHIDGKSFVPLLQGKTADTNRPLLFHSPNIWGEGSRMHANYGPATALRQGDWKLICRHTDTSFELYHLLTDIGEQHNLAAQEPQRVRDMARVMARLLQERNAQMPVYKQNNAAGAPAGTPVPLPQA